MDAFWTDLARDCLRIAGADASSFLQSQISQDIRNLADGESVYSFVLQPMGKVEALVRIRRLAGDEFVLDTDAGSGAGVAARLNRFKIRVAVEIAPLSLRCIAVRNSPTAVAHGVSAWGLADAYDVFGDGIDPPLGIREAAAAELDEARIEAGWPAMGHEVTETSIPAETGHVVPLAVSFTKGCYPGQELVERMDSRGSAAPRFVRRLRGDGYAPASGTELMFGDKTVGAVTSVAPSSSGGWVALSVVGRAVQPGDTVWVGGIGGETAVEGITVDKVTVDKVTVEDAAPRSH